MRHDGLSWWELSAGKHTHGTPPGTVQVLVHRLMPGSGKTSIGSKEAASCENWVQQQVGVRRSTASCDN